MNNSIVKKTKKKTDGLKGVGVVDGDMDDMNFMSPQPKDGTAYKEFAIREVNESLDESELIKKFKN